MPDRARCAPQQPERRPRRPGREQVLQVAQVRGVEPGRRAPPFAEPEEIRPDVDRQLAAVPLVQEGKERGETVRAFAGRSDVDEPALIRPCPDLGHAARPGHDNVGVGARREIELVWPPRVRAEDAPRDHARPRLAEGFGQEAPVVLVAEGIEPPVQCGHRGEARGDHGEKSGDPCHQKRK